MFGRSSLGFSSREILFVIATGVLAVSICRMVHAAPVGDPAGHDRGFAAALEVPPRE